MVQEINTDIFDMEVVNNDGITVVDFFANWCGPCRKLSPILEEVERDLETKVKFTKIDTDENIKITKKYQVSGLPTLLVFIKPSPAFGTLPQGREWIASVECL